MIFRPLITLPQMPPDDAALDAKCDNCMVQYFANKKDMTVEPKLSPSKAHWFWIVPCPKCQSKIVFSEFFAEEIK